jgi:hypothetical protein
VRSELSLSIVALDPLELIELLQIIGARHFHNQKHLSRAEGRNLLNQAVRHVEAPHTFHV